MSSESRLRSGSRYTSISRAMECKDPSTTASNSAGSQRSRGSKLKKGADSSQRDEVTQVIDSEELEGLVDLTHPSSNTLGDSNTLWSWLREVAELRQAA